MEAGWLSASGIRRGQRCVRLLRSPADGLAVDAGPRGDCLACMPFGEIAAICRGLSMLLRPYVGLAGAFLQSLPLGHEKSTIVKSCFFLNVRFCHRGVRFRWLPK